MKTGDTQLGGGTQHGLVRFKFWASWFAVCNDEGIVAYFADEPTAFRFRLAEINRELNG